MIAGSDDPDRPAVTGKPEGSARNEAVTGDDAPPGATPYPSDGVSPDRGSSAPREED